MGATRDANTNSPSNGTVSLRGAVQWSLRAHWTVLYPWALVVAQAVLIIALLVTLDYNQKPGYKNAAKGCREDSPILAPSPELLDKLASNVHIDKRISRELPIADRIRNQPHPKVFYNRVPKCGTHTLLDVIIEMARIHNFTFARSSVYMAFHADEEWQEILAQRMAMTEPPLLYERHFHFMDFEKYGTPQPVYFNLIRDPLERMASWYYFRRFQDGHEREMPLNKRIRSFDECVLGNYSECVDAMGNEAEEGFFNIIPFFCGQEDICRTDSDMALARAIQNVKAHYAVVGVTELYTEFIEVLENVLPEYFAGMSTVYQTQNEYYGKKHETTYKLPISREAANVMYPRLKREYKFYTFIKARFSKLYSEMKDLQTKYDDIRWFSNEPLLEFTLDRFTDKEDMKNAIQAMRYQGGETDTAGALRMMRQQVYLQARGDRPNFRNVALMITDGDSTKSHETEYEADRAHEADISMFVVGVTDQIEESELKHIASDPDEVFYFNSTEIRHLDTILTNLVSHVCDSTV